MATITLKTVLINNEALPNGYLPNTLKYKLGIGEKQVVVVQNGNTTKTIPSIDATTKKSMFSIEVKPTGADSNTEDMTKFIARIGRALGTLGISVTSADDNSKRFFPNCSLINEPDINDSVDGTIVLDFEGDPAQL